MKNFFFFFYLSRRSLPEGERLDMAFFLFSPKAFIAHLFFCVLLLCLRVKQTKVGPLFNFWAMILSHAVLSDALSVSVFYWMENGGVRCTFDIIR